MSRTGFAFSSVGSRRLYASCVGLALLFLGPARPQAGDHDRSRGGCDRLPGSPAGPQSPEGSEGPGAESLPRLEPNEVPVALRLGDVRVWDGAVELSVHVDTGGSTHAFEELSFGVACLESRVFSVESVEVGGALVAYALENGEPPICDIVIYPSRQASVGSISKLFAAEPFDSTVYGTEFLRVRYSIMDPSERRTRLQLFTAEDMYWRSRNDFIVLPNAKDSSEVVLRGRGSLVPGDVNEDSKIEITDAIAMLGFLFLAESVACEAAADFDENSIVNLADPVLLLGALFAGAASSETICRTSSLREAGSCDSRACDPEESNHRR